MGAGGIAAQMADGLARVVLTPDGKSYAYAFVRMLSRLYVVQGLK